MINNNNLQEILNKIKQLTLIEANNLVSLLKQEFNITSLESSLNLNINDSESKKKTIIEKTEFSLFLDKIPQDKKISALKIIKKTLNLNLKEAKDFVDSVPKLVKDNLNKIQAEELKKELEDIGATVRLV